MSPPANGLHELAALCAASIMCVTHGVRYGTDERCPSLEAPAARQPVRLVRCVGAHRRKAQGRGGVEQALDGPPVSDPSPVPVSCSSACHPSTMRLPCSMWALGSWMPQCPLCDLIYVSK